MKQAIILFLLFSPLFSIVMGNNKLNNLDSLIVYHEDYGNTIPPNERIDLLIDIGDILKNIYPDSSIYYYQLAIIEAEENSKKEEQAKLFSRIGGANYVKGEYDISLEYFLLGLNIWKEIKSKPGIARGLNNVALIYHMLENREKAIENHRISSRICEEIGDSIMLGINYFNMSLIYKDLKKYDSALLYAQYDYNIQEALKSPKELLKLNTLLGHIYLDKGDLQMAKDAFSITINTKPNTNKWDVCYALAGLADTELKLGNILESIKYGEQSLELAKEINAIWDIQYITGILSRSYAKLGDTRNAYYYHKKHKKYSDSTFNTTKDKKINYLKLKQKEAEYLLLEKENEIVSQQIRKKNIQVFMVILAFIVVLLIAGILFRISYIKSKLNRQLVTKNEEIAEKNKELVRLNNTKDTLFRIIGHDLKNPMSTVVSFTDMALSNYDHFEKEEIKEFITISKKSANDAIGLLENLLEWARNQTETKEIVPVKIKVLDLVTNITDSLENSLKAKRINLTVNVPPELHATLDINMTSVIIRNILTNAIKFTNKGGEIIIAAKQDNSKTVFSISDNGVGMDKEKLDGLFKMGSTSSSLGTNKEIGIGIGLLLCNDLAKKQGGEIWVKSSPGHGSTFFLKL